MAEAAGATPPHESPLVPNAKLRQMYEAMVQCRALTDTLRKRGRKVSPPETRGQEACRVSALIDLSPDDFVSEVPGSAAAAFLRGADLLALLEPEKAKSGSKQENAPGVNGFRGILPVIEDTADRFTLALGAALTFKRLKLPHIVVVLAESSAAKNSQWQKTWLLAAEHELAILFVALPTVQRKGAKDIKPFELSARATAAGVPGIPVEASDAVALYRVAQESIGRARAGGGPALMQCVLLPTKDSGQSLPVDPIRAMGRALLARQTCTETWLLEPRLTFNAQLKALGRKTGTA